MSLITDQKYIGLISPRLSKFKYKGDGTYNFRCPICGDSKKDQNKARGYFLFADNKSMRFWCHNCQQGMPLGRFIQRIDPQLYRQYAFEAFHGKKYQEPSPPQRVESKSDTPNILIDQILDRCDKLPMDHHAVRYLASRKIPRDKYSTLYYIDQISKIKQLAPKYDNLGNEPRLLIPAFERDGKLIGFAARALDDRYSPHVLRYVVIKVTESLLIFGLERVNLNNHVYVVEGPLDSLFLPNAIAAGSSSLSKVYEYVSREHSTMVFDNQPNNKEIVKIMKGVIDAGYPICIWSNDIAEKDINEMILAGKTQEEVKAIIDRNTFSGLSAMIKFAAWKRI